MNEKELIKEFKVLASDLNEIKDDIGIDTIKIPGKASLAQIDKIFDEMMDKADVVKIPDELSIRYNDIGTQANAILSAQNESAGEDPGPTEPPPSVNTSDKAQPQQSATDPVVKKPRKPRAPNKPKPVNGPTSPSEDLEKAIGELFKGASDETIDQLNPATLRTILKVVRK